MIYGQDEPVATPTIDLYDTNMMQMYVNAAREQYKAAQEEQKEFLKTYGDFYSPFAKDNDFWYNHTMGPVQNLFNEAAARGIDLARSPEGRAMLARVLRDIPYAKLATIRRNAAAGEEYLKNRAALQKAGKYNDDYEKYILGQAGFPAFEDWDSSTMGAWTRTSPEEYKDLHDSTYQWVDNNKKRYLRMTPDGRYQIWGVTDDDIRSSLTPHLSGFVGNNLGAYHLANAKREVLAENPNMSDDEANAAAMKRLQDNIVQANREYTYEEREADPYATLAQKEAYDAAREARQRAFTAAEHAKDRANDNYWKQKEFDAKYGNDNRPLSLTEILDEGSNRKQDKLKGVDTYGRPVNSEGKMDLSTVEQNVKRIISYNDNLHKNKRGDVYHGKIANYWRRMFTNGHLDASKLKKAKVINSNGQMHEAYYRALDKTYSAHRYNAKTGEQLVNDYAMPYYNNHSVVIPTGSTIANNSAMNALFGNNITKYGGYGNKYRSIKFGKQYHYAYARAAQVLPKTGGGSGVHLRKESIYRKFDKFLKEGGGVTMWQAPGNQDVYYTKIGNQRDLRSWASIPYEKLEAFFDKNAKSEIQKMDLIRSLGLKAYDEDSKIIGADGKQKWDKIKYIQIPISKTIDNETILDLGEWDLEYDKARFGAKSALDYAPYRESDAFLK